MKAKLLIADDDEQIRDLLTRFLEKFEYRIDTAAHAAEAMALMQSGEYQLVLTDKNMPDEAGNIEGGMQVVAFARDHLPDTEVIMMTGFATVETAVEAMKLGAVDYIMKPVSLEELKEKIDRILEYKRFINSKNTLTIFRNLQNQVLEILSERTDIPDDKQSEVLRNLGTKIDHVFGLQKGYESIIQVQADALERIAELVEHLKEAVSEESPYYALIESIREESKKRIGHGTDNPERHLSG